MKGMAIDEITRLRSSLIRLKEVHLEVVGSGADRDLLKAANLLVEAEIKLKEMDNPKPPKVDNQCVGMYPVLTMYYTVDAHYLRVAVDGNLAACVIRGSNRVCVDQTGALLGKVVVVNDDDTCMVQYSGVARFRWKPNSEQPVLGVGVWANDGYVERHMGATNTVIDIDYVNQTCDVLLG